MLLKRDKRFNELSLLSRQGTIYWISWQQQMMITICAFEILELQPHFCLPTLWNYWHLWLSENIQYKTYSPGYLSYTSGVDGKKQYLTVAPYNNIKD